MPGAGLPTQIHVGEGELEGPIRSPHPHTSPRVGSHKASLCDLGLEGARRVLKEEWKISAGRGVAGRGEAAGRGSVSLLVQVGRQQQLWRQEIQVTVADLHLPPALQVSTG